MISRMHSFRQWLSAREEGQIQVELLVAIGRNRSADAVEEIADRLLLLYEAGLIVGMALSGPEKGHPVQRFQRTFERFREAGLGVEIHAGEWCGPESVWDALTYGFPQRLGHGVTAFRDPELLQHLAEQAIHLEFCPTSNLCTQSVLSLEEHPLAQARTWEGSFSVSTDDPGVFGCTLESEYNLLVERFGFDEEALLQLSRDALRARFQKHVRTPALAAFLQEQER